MNKIREIREIIDPRLVIEGAGVLLRRSIAPNPTNLFDPFLLFDHFAFNDPVEGPIRGFPMHPHRGIETVTYIIKGSVNHRDSLGNSGLIGPGDVQWMTAGSGILHEEMPRRGPDGIINGFQLWVNLPAAKKWTTPRYQGIVASGIPIARGKGWQARVVAGEVIGVNGPVKEIAADPTYLEISMLSGSEFSIHLPSSHTLLAYVFEGTAYFGSQEISAAKMVKFGMGDKIEVRSLESTVRFMLIAGAPIGEPIVPYGPFVMNTQEEIQQALSDLRNGTFIRQVSSDH
jgi:redox-sensitive bicupin YhaK (pirin superfamily)